MRREHLHAGDARVRILHVGNIANNAYNNAKFLRRKGVEADVLCYDYRHVMAQPEWEDAQFDAQPDEFSPCWEEIDLGSFRRPSWFIQDELIPARRRAKRWFRGQFHVQACLQDPSLLMSILTTYRACRAAQSRPRPRLTDILRTYLMRNQFDRWFDGYDLIQAYATEPIHAWMFARDRPCVAFEHGTMRDIPFEDSGRGRLLSLAYRQARKVLITNPDVVTAARRLGLRNFQFIPHPVDEIKYRPGPSLLRHTLTDRWQTDLILFAPSRHNWLLKGNDRLIRAFARFLKATHRNPILILCGWGQEVDRSRTLIDDLGIAAKVVWTPPLNKMKLIQYYNAADIVLDQFTIGTFGTVTPEAMACAKPVVLHFDRQVHEWCYAEMPPVVSAGTEDEIFQRISELADDPGYRSAVGQASREWVVKHHGWELVADRQISIYRELLQR
jgi:glycosyltransferase involved in cell wall biosynthesis